MSDILRLDYINSLPQPLLVRFCGDKDWWWPVHDIDVETGLMRIDACGLLQSACFSEVAEIQDCNSVIHDPDTFYAEWQDGAA